MLLSDVEKLRSPIEQRSETSARHRRIKKVGREGDVKVLARAYNGSTWEAWLGGDRTVPELIKSGLPINFEGYLDVTGNEQGDWIVALKWGNTIAVYYGNQTLGSNWEYSGDYASILVYKRYGFWSQNQETAYRPANNNRYAVYVDNPNTIPPLGTVERSGYHQQTGGQAGGSLGLGTVAVEYYENRFISGSRSVNWNNLVRNYYGFNFVPYPIAFSGTNYYTERSSGASFWEGDVQGPGYLGPGGSPCAEGSPDINGTEKHPVQKGNNTLSVDRQYSTQIYFSWAHGGNPQTNVGAESISFSSEQSQINSSGGGLKSLEFLGSCQLFTSGGRLWTIDFLASSATYWPLEDGSNSFSQTTPTYSYNCSVQISPTASKNNFRTISNPDNSFFLWQYNEETYSPIKTISNGYVYNKLVRGGTTGFDSTVGASGRGAIVSDKKYMNFNGNEFEITQDVNNAVYTFGAGIHPVGWTTGIPANILEDSEVDVVEWVPTSAIIPVWEDRPSIKKIALSMADAGQSVSTIEAKYYPG
jgi:hypothetical protein